MKKFISWAGGIVAAVVSGVLIYRLTTPTPVPPPPPPMTFEGMVIDGAQNTPVQGAMVTFEIKEISPNSGPYHDFTDEHGSYRKDFSGLDKSSSVVVHAQAHGFGEVRAFTFNPLGGDNLHDFMLMPLPVAHPGATPPPAATPHPEVLTHPPVFVRKMDVSPIQVQLQKR